MKKQFLIIFLLIVSIFIPTTVLADDLEITGSDVKVRKGPGTTYGSYVMLNKGKTLSLLSTTKVADEGKNGLCDIGWYKVSYDGNVGYVCATYGKVLTTQAPVITEEAKNTCEQDLKNKGFPKEYWSGLCNIKVAHPTWQINAVNTGLDFAVAVERESACGKNTLVTSDESYKDTSCNANLDSGYSHASQRAVAYYLNPLNFLDEKNIFMFESNYANTAISDENYRILVNKFLSSYIKNGLPTLDSAMAIAGRENNVNQVMLAARIVQELGSSGLATTGDYKGKLLSCISGDYTTRWNIRYDNGESLDHYYNFFNVGVGDGSNKSASEKAVRYAFKNKWGGTGDQATDLKMAIGGGASFLKTKYLDKGQYTIYAQKFNVHPTNSSSLFVNQYMSNLKAPSSEAANAYNKYKSNNLLESPFIFYVPIYNNLNAVISNSSSGATGEGDNNNSNGLSVPSIVTSAGYKISGSTVSSISPGTSLDDIKSKLSATGGTVTASSNTIGTGTVITVSNGTTSNKYTVIIRGDTSGDGEINALDLLKVQKHILNSSNLSNEYLSAADTSGDGIVNALDLLQIQKSILGTGNIVQ